MSNVITPNKARTLRKELAETRAALTVQAKKVRALRATGRILDREDGDALAYQWGVDAAYARRIAKRLRDACVVKGSAYSLAAAARVCNGPIVDVRFGGSK